MSRFYGVEVELVNGLLDQADDYLSPPALPSRGAKVCSGSLRQRHNAIDACQEVAVIKEARDSDQLLLIRIDDEEGRFGALILCSLAVGSDRNHTASGPEHIPGALQSRASHPIE